MKMQVPAYCPLVAGVHWAEKSGVLKEVKNVMAISAMLMDMDIWECDIDMDVEVAMDIPVVVAVDIDIVPWDISISMTFERVYVQQLSKSVGIQQYNMKRNSTWAHIRTQNRNRYGLSRRSTVSTWENPHHPRVRATSLIGCTGNPNGSTTAAI